VSTFALAQTGTGGTTAASKTIIGSAVTFPAGGPWTVCYVWGMAAHDTTIPDQGTGGQLIVESVSGDISPDPAPGKFPLIGNAIHSSANSPLAANPLNLWEVDWQASGKAQMAFYYLNQLAITTGSDVAAGVIFGTERPARRPIKFCDGVYSSFASATEQSIGTITLAEKATRITGILADCNKGDASTAGEPVLATIRLNSADVKLPPSQYPCNRCFDASDGTAVGAPSTPQSQFIPVDIPVLGGARIDVYATSSASVTGNIDINVFIAYE